MVRWLSASASGIELLTRLGCVRIYGNLEHIEVRAMCNLGTISVRLYSWQCEKHFKLYSMKRELYLLYYFIMKNNLVFRNSINCFFANNSFERKNINNKLSVLLTGFQ